MGLRLLELAGEQRIAANALDTAWVEMGKDGRAPHVTASRVKFARSAFDKRMEYRSASFKSSRGAGHRLPRFLPAGLEEGRRHRRRVHVRRAPMPERRADGALGSDQAGTLKAAYRGRGGGLTRPKLRQPAYSWIPGGRAFESLWLCDQPRRPRGRCPSLERCKIAQWSGLEQNVHLSSREPVFGRLGRSGFVLVVEPAQRRPTPDEPQQRLLSPGGQKCDGFAQERP